MVKLPQTELGSLLNQLLGKQCAWPHIQLLELQQLAEQEQRQQASELRPGARVMSQHKLSRDQCGWRSPRILLVADRPPRGFAQHAW